MENVLTLTDSSKPGVAVRVRHVRMWDEYAVAIHVDGVLQEGLTYFTSDRLDALGTAEKMLHNYNPTTPKE